MANPFGSDKNGAGLGTTELSVIKRRSATLTLTIPCFKYQNKFVDISLAAKEETFGQLRSLNVHTKFK